MLHVLYAALVISQEEDILDFHWPHALHQSVRVCKTHTKAGHVCITNQIIHTIYVNVRVNQLSDQEIEARHKRPLFLVREADELIWVEIQIS